jgi:hypothetical protein
MSNIDQRLGNPKRVDLSQLHSPRERLVGATQQVLSNNPLEILVLTLDAVPRAPVRLYGQGPIAVASMVPEIV